MAKYILLVNWTDQGIRNVDETIGRAEAFKEMGSLAFCEKLIKETGIALSPGIGFGEEGEGFVRIAISRALFAFSYWPWPA